jgi:hypothetical protein
MHYLLSEFIIDYINARHATLTLPKAREASFTGSELLCHCRHDDVPRACWGWSQASVARSASVGPHETRLSIAKATRMLGDQLLYC